MKFILEILIIKYFFIVVLKHRLIFFHFILDSVCVSCGLTTKVRCGSMPENFHSRDSDRAGPGLHSFRAGLGPYFFLPDSRSDLFFPR